MEQIQGTVAFHQKGYLVQATVYPLFSFLLKISLWWKHCNFPSFFCKIAFIPGQLILNKKQVTWQVKDISIGW